MKINLSPAHDLTERQDAEIYECLDAIRRNLEKQNDYRLIFSRSISIKPKSASTERKRKLTTQNFCLCFTEDHQLMMVPTSCPFRTINKGNPSFSFNISLKLFPTLTNKLLDFLGSPQIHSIGFCRKSSPKSNFFLHVSFSLGSSKITTRKRGGTNMKKV